ncbi:MAG: RNA 2',3'-cyclic phosphodiesterase [Firmicutes bacterium HGW-Firmicutes-19]|jgi:RNA 2',3'-cyclic 3'-phosphodiesterase|nr:MAG: RNA 2',3'-cyclic phosphodiesterase [Firmicutes bacterium HGW-Firmicutes-19]
MRIFIAFALEEHVKEKLHVIQQQLKPIYHQGRFKQSKNMHMTLRFVGEVTVEQFDQLIIEIEKKIHQYSSLTTELDQLGFFGKSAKKHSLWIGCPPMPAMTNLSNELTHCVSAANIPVNDTPFVPHITLAQHGALIETLPNITPVTVRFSQVCVFLSTRIDGELVYQPLKCWQLK